MKKHVRQVNNIVNEAVSIQFDISHWLESIKKKKIENYNLSAKLLLKRCEALSKKIDELKTKITDNITLSLLIQNQITMTNSIEQIKNVLQTIKHEQTLVEASDTIVDNIQLTNFRNKLISEVKLHEKTTTENK